MKHVKGDLIKLALNGQFDVIVHGCNCFCTMGAGIARGIAYHFPRAYDTDLNTRSGDITKLGHITWIKQNGLFVENGYTQFELGASDRPISYTAVREVFKRVKQEFSGLRIGYPAIGSGLAGGDWDIISKIIEEELAGEDHTFVEYDKN